MTWISVKEGASLYGLDAAYFRRNYCGPDGIMKRRGGLRERKGPKGRRRMEVCQEVIEAMMAEEKGETG